MENKFDIEKLEQNLKSKTEGFDLCYMNSSSENVSFENNKLFSIESNFSEGLGFRIVKNGKIGFSTTSNPERIDKTVEFALQSSEYGEKALFEFPKQPEVKKTLKYYDKNTADYKLLDTVAIGEKLVKLLNKKIDDSIVSAEFSKDIATSLLKNSSGMEEQIDSTDFSFSVGFNKMDKNGILDIYESITRVEPVSEDVMFELTEKILKKYELCNKIIEIESGKYPMIFNKYSIGLLYSPFLSAANGKVFQKGISPLSEKINEKIIDERITIYDNPLLDGFCSSFEIDAEGVKAYKKPIIEKGVFKGFIFDLFTASLAGAQTTGNAARSYSSRPSPSFSNIEVSAGDIDYEQMISQIDKGILVENVIGGGQSNLLAGDFSVNLALAFYIEKGKIIGRVKDSMIAGNSYQIFNDIKFISKDLFRKSSMLTPAVCFNSIDLVQ